MAASIVAHYCSSAAQPKETLAEVYVPFYTKSICIMHGSPSEYSLACSTFYLYRSNLIIQEGNDGADYEGLLRAQHASASHWRFFWQRELEILPQRELHDISARPISNVVGWSMSGINENHSWFKANSRNVILVSDSTEPHGKVSAHLPLPE